MYVPKIDISVTITTRKNARPITITSTADAAKVCRKLFDPGKIKWIEEFVMIALNQQQVVQGYYRVSRGGMTGTVADIRVISTIALSCLATSVILAHNHPTGALKPSQADKLFTTQIVRALAILDITVIDHLIITPQDFFSFHKNDLLK